MIIPLREPLWMMTPFGEALARFLTDYGPESDHLWTCIQQEGEYAGMLCTWHNSEVRVLSNFSMLRREVAPLGRNPMANNMQTPGKITRGSAKLLMRNKGTAKAKSPKRKALKKALKRP